MLGLGMNSRVGEVHRDRLRTSGLDRRSRHALAGIAEGFDVTPALCQSLKRVTTGLR